MAAHDPVSMSPGALLHADHERLDRLYVQLVDAFRGGDWDDVRIMWDAFESGLRAHMEAEERYVLPALREVDPAEADALRAEHDAVRARVAELGVAADLHMVKDDVAADLIDKLRAHARREDALAYRFADRSLSPEAARGVHGLAPKAAPMT